MPRKIVRREAGSHAENANTYIFYGPGSCFSNFFRIEEGIKLGVYTFSSSEVAIYLYCKAASACRGRSGLHLNPGVAKSMGRAVLGFDSETWDDGSPSICDYVLLHKFAQHSQLKAALLATGDKVIGEAAPHDLRWGTGIGLGERGSLDPASWHGVNMLGKSLMRVREVLRSGVPIDDSIAEMIDATFLDQIQSWFAT